MPGDKTGEGPRLSEFDIRIARDGTWWHAGSPFTRPALVRLFSTVLRRTEDGRFMLATPVERGYVEVEDTPFLAVEMQIEGTGRERAIRFRTNVDEWVTAGAAHPIRVSTDPGSGEPSPVVLVRDGLEARIVRPVFYDLVEQAEEAEHEGRPALGVWSAGVFFLLGPAAGP